MVADRRRRPRVGRGARRETQCASWIAKSAGVPRSSSSSVSGTRSRSGKLLPPKIGLLGMLDEDYGTHGGSRFADQSVHARKGAERVVRAGRGPVPAALHVDDDQGGRL